MLPDQAQLQVSLSLADIYGTLCPDCRDALLELLSGQAQTAMLKSALRASLDHPRGVGAAAPGRPDLDPGDAP